MSTNHLAPVTKAQAFRILAKAASYGFPLPFKILNEQKVFRTRLRHNDRVGVFFLLSRQDELRQHPNVAIKLTLENQVFFLRTQIKETDGHFYFDSYEHLYELVRRKKPRFLIPEIWPQAASFRRSSDAKETAAEIVEMSSIGMQLRYPARTEVKRGEVLQLKFKVFRRSEVTVAAKVIYARAQAPGPSAMGVEFSADHGLALNKIQNVCEDLAFHYAAEKN